MTEKKFETLYEVRFQLILDSRWSFWLSPDKQLAIDFANKIASSNDFEGWPNYKNITVEKKRLMRFRNDI